MTTLAAVVLAVRGQLFSGCVAVVDEYDRHCNRYDKYIYSTVVYRYAYVIVKP